jgi:dCTP deaminase
MAADTNAYRDVKSLFPDLERDLRSFSTGILPSQEIEALVDRQAVRASVAIGRDQIQPASIDLRLGSTAYRVRASFLTGKRDTVASKIEDLCMHEIDLARPAVLEKGCVYIVPLLEELHLTRDLSAKANPKSTTGRLDIFTRLITDYGIEFERVPPGYKGKLYVEVVPRTFSVLVAQGTKLNQLRFMRGHPLPSDKEHRELDERESLVYLADESRAPANIDDGLWVSVDLSGSVVGYKAKRHTPLVDLARVNYYDPLEFWEPILELGRKRLVLDPNDFYILVSKERIRVPPNYAAEMVAYDPSVGEFRIHYAGFFDPGFGYGSDDILGTRAVLEVRSHEVPFLIEDGQTVGRLIYERLLDKPTKIYGRGIGSSYQSQGLALSKQFKDFGKPEG